MAVDPIELVEIYLDPVFALDDTLQASIPTVVDAETALQGWTPADMTDLRNVYIAKRTTYSLIGRLLLKFAQEIKEVKGGKAATEFQDAVKFLKELRAQLENEIAAAAAEADPEDLDILANVPPWPGVGVVGWQKLE